MAPILGEVFDRFVQDCPLPVMAQAVLENAFEPLALDRLFEDVAQRQYTRKLLFSSVVDLMGLVVCRIRPAVHAAYQARAETIDASLRAVYNKLDHLEPAIAAEMVAATARRLESVIAAMPGGAVAPLLPGYRVKIVDGNHLAGTEHRLKPLRTIGAGALPGQALVVFDPGLMLITDVIPCEDGHAQERSLFDRILPLVRAKDLWIEDRNFCTTDLLFGIAAREGFVVVRQHAATLHWQLVGKRRACGRIETGHVFEQTIRIRNDAGEVLFLRRVTVVLDKPTRDGDTEIHLLTNVPVRDAKAKTIAELYRARWRIETAFCELATALRGEVDTLGYPKAALFGFCVALVAYNALSTVKAALRSAHGERVVAEKVSDYYVAEEVAMTHRGMMVAIPEEEWSIFRGMEPVRLAEVLVGLARGVKLSLYRKHPRGPKTPRPKRASGAKIKHVSTARLLEGLNKCT